MAYNLTLVDSDGEEYPYSEELDGGSYHYKISIILGDRDGELQVMTEGVHIEFDDGEWMDFYIPAPKKLFPGMHRLSEVDLLQIMAFIASDQVETKSYSESDIAKLYERYETENA